MTILMVSGSRTLCAHAESRARVVAAMQPHLVGVTLVIAGDAKGPDRWALDEAYRLGIDWERWAFAPPTVDGTLRATLRWTEQRRVSPLDRNRAMVLDVAKRFPNALVLGFVDPASSTHGTDHTLTIARSARLRVVRLVFDAARAAEGAGR